HRRLRQQFPLLFERGQAGVGLFIGQAEVHRVEHVQRRVHDLRADTVAADDRDCLGHWGDVRANDAARARGVANQMVETEIMPESRTRPKPTKVCRAYARPRSGPPRHTPGPVRRPCPDTETPRSGTTGPAPGDGTAQASRLLSPGAVLSGAPQAGASPAACRSAGQQRVELA